MLYRTGMRSQTGYTLVEVLIVVAIVGIIAAIAVPAYNAQMQRGKRVAAQGEMLKISEWQQQFLLANRSFGSKTSLEASGFKLDSQVATNYDYSIDLGTGAVPTYLVTFRPKGSMTDTSTLTLNQSGVGTPVDEWKR